MAESLVIRAARADDAEAIHAALLDLARHIGDTDKIRSTVEDIRDYGFGDTPLFEGLIAEVVGENAGICLFFPSFSTWFGRPGIYIQDLIIPEKFRGRGIGEALLRRAALIGKSRGCTYMRLAVDHENPGAMTFYRKLGFVHRHDDLIYAAYGDVFEALAVENGSAS